MSPSSATPPARCSPLPPITCPTSGIVRLPREKMQGNHTKKHFLDLAQGHKVLIGSRRCRGMGHVCGVIANDGRSGVGSQTDLVGGLGGMSFTGSSPFFFQFTLTRLTRLTRLPGFTGSFFVLLWPSVLPWHFLFFGLRALRASVPGGAWRGLHRASAPGQASPRDPTPPPSTR